MPIIDVQGTSFAFSILPLPLLSSGDVARIEIAIKNEFVDYQTVCKNISANALDEAITAMHRFLAGAYAHEYNLSFEQAGFAIDLYPYEKDGMPVSREERRQNDCVAAFRILMRSKDKRFLGGVYTILLHREELKEFADILREEYDKIFVRFGHGRGKFHFIGVSPLGYNGCNYWYFDETGTVQKGDYVWVKMGRHNREQIVYVDSVKDCTMDSLPCEADRVKDMLKKATNEEVKQAFLQLEK